MTIHIDERICKGCGLCVYYCPQNVLCMSNVRNTKGYYLVAVCNSNKCKVCHTCEINCPDLALYVEEDDKAKG